MHFDYLGLLIIAGKSIFIYAFILIAIRLFGKKELAQLSVIDLVFILLISNAVQNAMVGTDTSLTGGVAAALGLFAINYLLKVLNFYYPQFGKVTQGEAIMLIHDGTINRENLAKAMLTKDELDEAVREHGVDDCSDVNLAVMEVDGNISVISDNYQNKSVRRRKGRRGLKNQ
jgi:hypothetical protein